MFCLSYPDYNFEWKLFQIIGKYCKRYLVWPATYGCRPRKNLGLPLQRRLRDLCVKKIISSETSRWILQTFFLQIKSVSKRIRPHYNRIMFSEFHSLNEDFLTQLCRQTLKTTFELIRSQFWMKSQYSRCNFLWNLFQIICYISFFIF